MIHRTIAAAAAFVLALSFAGKTEPALAGDEHGNFMIRGLVTGVLPDTDASVFAGGARIPGANADVSDEVIPATTLTYFFNDNFAVELICCFAKHEVEGTGFVQGRQIFAAGLNIVAALPRRALT